MEVKITKRRKLKEVRNDMCWNWYYLINGRIYNDDNTRYRPFKFVIWFDYEDLWEYFKPDDVDDYDYYVKQDDIKTVLDEWAYSYTDMIRDYEDCDEFIDFCNETIDQYNSTNIRVGNYCW